MLTTNRTRASRVLGGVAIGLALLGSVAAVADPIEAWWKNPDGGDWTTGSNWSSAPNYPNNGGGYTYHAIIAAAGDPYTVSLGSDITLDRFTLNAASATLHHTSGVLSVLGTADLLAGTYRLDGGTIAGGTWNVAGGTFEITSNVGNTLDGVTFNGDLQLTARDAYLRIRNGLDLNGNVQLAGRGAVLEFDGSQVFDAATINIGSYYNDALVSASAGSVLTLGANALVQGGGGSISGAGDLRNEGRISANVNGRSLGVMPGGKMTSCGIMEAVNGGSLSVGAQGRSWFNAPGAVLRAENGTLRLGGNWNNDGIIEAINGDVYLGGEFRSADIGNLTRSGGEVFVSGLLDNSADELVLDSDTGSWWLAAGTVHGGTIRFEDGAKLLLGNDKRNYLDDVDIDGPLDFTADRSMVRLGRGTTFDGPAVLAGDGSALGLDTDQTFDREVVLGGPDAAATLSAEGSGTLTLGSQAYVHGNGWIMNKQFISGYGTVVNQGTIAADIEGGELVIWPRTFRNEGEIIAHEGTELIIGDTNGTWSNEATGSISATEATLRLRGQWSNTGSIHATDSTVFLDGEFSTPDLDSVECEGGRRHLLGVMDNYNQTLRLDASTGLLNMWSGSIEGGRIELRDGQQLTFGRDSTSGVTPQFVGVVFDGDLDVSHGDMPKPSGLRIDADTTILGDISVRDGSTLSIYGQHSFSNKLITLDAQSALAVGDVTLESSTQLQVSNGQLRATSPHVGLFNHGTIDLAPDGVFTIQATLNNEGLFTVGSGARVNGNSIWNGESGRIEAGVDSYLDLAGGGNQGQIELTGARLAANGQSAGNPWRNTGILKATDSNIALNTNWSNAGTIQIKDSELELKGSFTTDDLGTIIRDGGSVHIYGELNNTGRTLNLNATTGSWFLDGGTIRGGLVKQSDGARLQFRNMYNRLDGVHFLDDLYVEGDVRLRNSLDVDGDLHIGSAYLTVETPLLLDDTQIDIRDDSHLYTNQGVTLTLGPDLSLLAHAGGGRLVGSGTVRNLGHITAGDDLLVAPAYMVNEGIMEVSSQSTLEIRPAEFVNAPGGRIIAQPHSTLKLERKWHNEGTIELRDSYTWLGGTFSLGDLDGFLVDSSFIEIDGTLDLAGGTFHRDDPGSTWRNRGAMLNGVVDATESELQVYDGYFDDVVLRGHVHNFCRSDMLVGPNGLELDGAVIRMAGSPAALWGASMVFESSQELAGWGEIVLEDASNTYNRIHGEDGTTLTIGPDIYIHGQKAIIGPTDTSSEVTGLVNLGHISSDVDGGQIRMWAKAGLTNHGVLEARNGGLLMIDSRGPLANYNAATKTLTGGTWSAFDRSTIELQPGDILTNAANILLSGPQSSFTAIDTMETNQGSFTILSGCDFSTLGDLLNEGSLTVGVGSTLSVNGDFNQDLDGSLTVFIEGLASADEFGLLDVLNDADLAGELIVELLGGYSPNLGDRFEFLGAGMVFGVFDTYDLPTLPGGLAFEVEYGFRNVALNVVPEPAALMMVTMCVVSVRRR